VGIIDSVRFDNVAGKFRIVRNNPALGNVVYPIPAPVATVQAQNAHTATPWSTSDMSYKLSKGVVWYNTPSHGGFAFTEAAAQRLLTPAAIARAERYAGRLWFEEDCLASLVLLEHPEYMDMLGARASEADLLASIKTYNPGYLAERGLL
ncbi:MAG: hypothetical protein LAO03_12500, partial [Acidobacteriia bacterium]|nr:hypothetical protein [Terriglobia bacterium]